ncbi:ADP,ATP carrier protein 1, mitochondrial-like [Spinacia oleracea]|uniref:ADP/ATP translocase n=1 Tax=Spinacia oleracea TaxID=3562 RepID=A0ABM3QXI2_SPIOL|nr:ADP,ATP carrier protein 1, mitochondrial-like [Spinacia oleracea]
MNQGNGIIVLFDSYRKFHRFSHPVPLPPVASNQEPISKEVLIAFHLAEGIYTVAANTTMAPIERVHLLIQNQNELIKSGFLSTPYKGMEDCFYRTLKQDGIISLWRGNSLNVYKAIATQALALSITMNCWHNVGDNKSDKYGNFKFEAAVCCATLFQYPLDYARTRLANDVEAAGRVEFSLDSAPKN